MCVCVRQCVRQTEVITQLHVSECWLGSGRKQWMGSRSQGQRGSNAQDGKLPDIDGEAWPKGALELNDSVSSLSLLSLFLSLYLFLFSLFLFSFWAGRGAQAP